MRVKKVCFNCGYNTILNNDGDFCPACGGRLQVIGYLTGKKLSNMNSEQILHWIEYKNGHTIPDNLKTKLQTYYEQRHIIFEKEHNEFIQRRILEQQSKNIARMEKETNKQNGVLKCPICGSTNINNITLTKRAVKTAVFGVIGAIDDAGKTWKCNNCGSKF